MARNLLSNLVMDLEKDGVELKYATQSVEFLARELEKHLAKVLGPTQARRFSDTMINTLNEDLYEHQNMMTSLWFEKCSGT